MSNIDKVLRVIDQAASKTATARTRKKRKGTAQGFVTIWNDAVIDNHGKEYAVAATIKTMAQLKRALKRLPISDSPKKLENFLVWSVKNWEVVSAEELRTKKNIRNASPIPNLNTFVWAVDLFFFRYCRKEDSSVRSVSSEKRIARLEQQLKQAFSTIEDQRRKIALLEQEQRQARLRKNKRGVRHNGDAGVFKEWD